MNLCSRVLAILLVACSPLVVLLHTSPASAFPASMQLPFKKGQTWYVCQGYNGQITHHDDPALDVTTDKQLGENGCYGDANAAAGKPIYAPGSGTLARVSDSEGGVCITFNAGGSMYLGHLVSRRANGSVKAGDKIGKVGKAGQVNNGEYAHVHLSARTGSGCSGKKIPFSGSARFACAPNMTMSGKANQWAGQKLKRSDSCDSNNPPDKADGFASKGVEVKGTYLPIAGDFNGDARSDVLWYGPGGDRDAMWFGSGDGKFTFKDVTVKGTYVPLSGDFNGDGRSDVLWYGPGDDHDAMWLGSADGSFASKDVTVKGTYRPVTGDFNGDGKTDVLWYGPGDDHDAMWLASSDGNFTGKDVTVKGTYTPIAGDFNGDGKADVLWYGPGDDHDAMWLASSDGNFTGKDVTVTGTYTPIAGDFNADGKSDVFWYGPGDSKDGLWTATSDGAFSYTKQRVIGTYRPVAGNFDGVRGSDILWYGPGSASDTLWLAK